MKIAFAKRVVYGVKSMFLPIKIQLFSENNA